MADDSDLRGDRPALCCRGALRAASSGDLIEYGSEGTTIAGNDNGSWTVTDGASAFTLPTRDFNVRSLRSNLVVRWEWRPGSTAYLVWQQDGFADETLGAVRPGDLFDALDVARDHIFALKMSFWLPVR